MLTRWLNAHADFWWKRNRSEDEDAIRLAISILGTNYLMPENARWMRIAFTCYWQGQAYFVHRCRAKLLGPQPRFDRRLPMEARIMEIYRSMIPGPPPESREQRMRRLRTTRQQQLARR